MLVILALLSVCKGAKNAKRLYDHFNDKFRLQKVNKKKTTYADADLGISGR